MNNNETLATVELDRNKMISNVINEGLDHSEESKPMHKYHKIVRHGKNGTHEVAKEGEKIVIQEKLDGANASFKLENGKIRVFSRNNELNESNTLGGFYNWVHEKFKAGHLVPSHIYFGEWLNPHKINYGAENMKKFYLYDLYSELYEEYLPFDEVEAEAEHLGLNLIPVHYIGDFVSFEHMESFVGKSLLNPEVDAEGVVVKNFDYKGRHGEQVFTKIVSKSFAEKQPQPLAKAPAEQSEERKFAGMFLTEARVEKILHKLVDEQVINELAVENMGVILKNAGQRLFEDMIEEERDELPENYDEKEIKRSIGKVLPAIVKTILERVGGM